jgi:hypothetical protein
MKVSTFELIPVGLNSRPGWCGWSALTISDLALSLKGTRGGTRESFYFLVFDWIGEPVGLKKRINSSMVL